VGDSQAIPDSAGHDVASLAAYWRRHAPEVELPAPYRQVATRFLELGEPLLAFDVAGDGLKRWTDDVPLRQLRGVALSRSGATDAACAAFRELADQGHDDEETLANLARTYKAKWLRQRGAPDSETWRRQAFEGYWDAYRRSGGYWSGINAAVLALAGGRREESQRIAAEVLALCKRQLGDLAQREGDYWLRATCGEAALIAGRIDEAVRWYIEAAAIAGRRYANVASTRAQARLICELADFDWSLVSSCFTAPRIVAFSGHMIDVPGRDKPRFPPALVSAVAHAIRERLSRHAAVIGFSSAACGADLLFLEALADRGSDAVVVLPFAEEQFMHESVMSGGPEWRQRFEATVRRGGEPIVASSWNVPADSAAFDYANRLLSGLAKIQADLLDAPVELMAVWDGQADGPAGGTSDLVRRWRAQGLPVDHIDIAKLLREAGPFLPRESRVIKGRQPQAPSSAGARPQQVVAMLFADVRGFHRLSDEQIIPFVDQFLTSVADLMRSADATPLAVNTWGDGFFATFSSVGEAGSFALRLADLVATTPWANFGLPADLSMRIALHAGPAFAIEDPVTRRRSFWGGHVSRAARIEPITPPGQVYASRAFAALARDEGNCRFFCEYVGQTPLAKGYGAFPMYHVRSGA